MLSFFSFVNILCIAVCIKHLNVLCAGPAFTWSMAQSTSVPQNSDVPTMRLNTPALKTGTTRSPHSGANGFCYLINVSQNMKIRVALVIK